jgi:hypothetical protein
VIIFDTNALRSLSLTGAVATLLQAIAKDASQKLAISSVTEDEFLSAQRRHYQQRVDEFSKASRALEKVFPKWEFADSNLPSLESAVERDYRLMASMFTILPLEGEHAIQALQRETDRKRPASTDGSIPGFGARDVAIWLTAIAHAASSGDPVYLVSADAKAFGKGELAEELKLEALAKGAQIILCPDVTNLLDRFAEKVDLDFDISFIFKDPDLISWVRGVISQPTFMEATTVIRGSESLFESDGIQGLTFNKTRDTQAYLFGGQTWAAVPVICKGTRTMRRTAVDGSTIEEWEVSVSQNLTLLVLLTGQVLSGGGVPILGMTKAEVIKRTMHVYGGGLTATGFSGGPAVQEDA